MATLPHWWRETDHDISSAAQQYVVTWRRREVDVEGGESCVLKNLTWTSLHMNMPTHTKLHYKNSRCFSWQWILEVVDQFATTRPTFATLCQSIESYTTRFRVTELSLMSLCVGGLCCRKLEEPMNRCAITKTIFALEYNVPTHNIWPLDRVVPDFLGCSKIQEWYTTKFFA